MHLDYHIPVPHLTPTIRELQWAKEHIIPQCEDFISNCPWRWETFKIDSKLLDGWNLVNRIKMHFDMLSLKIRRMSFFIGLPGINFKFPHIDSDYYDHVEGTGVPMIARLNVPLQGTRNSRLSWWNADATDPRIINIIPLKVKNKPIGTDFNILDSVSYHGDREADWSSPSHVEIEPGPCWNRVELAHQLDLKNITETRINLTTEIDTFNYTSVSWQTLVERLQAKGYCHS